MLRFTCPGVNKLIWRVYFGCCILSAAAGVIIAMYGVSKVVFWMSSEFMSINFATVGYIGFSLGIFTTVVVASGVVFTRRLLSLSPKLVYDAAFSAVKSNPQVSCGVGGAVCCDCRV